MEIRAISSVYGQAFHQMTSAWYYRNSQYLPYKTKFCLVSLDGEANKDIVSFVDYSFIDIGKNEKTLGWGDGDLPRLKKITSLCANGSVCVHMDLDLALLKNISPIIELNYDFIISRAFAFPKRVVDKLGFVACTGFYIAKPESVPLLTEWIKRMESKSQVDQLALNEIFENLEWNTIKKAINNVEYTHAVSSWNNVSLLVLDSEVLPRGMEKQTENSFGVHNPRVLKEFWGMGEVVD